MPEAIQFNPAVIQQAAAQLYSKARSVIALYILMGGIGGTALFVVLSKNSQLALIGLFVGVFIGAVLGNEKAFKYKLEAQLALCQLQIEINTRQAG